MAWCCGPWPEQKLTQIYVAIILGAKIAFADRYYLQFKKVYHHLYKYFGLSCNRKSYEKLTWVHNIIHICIFIHISDTVWNV